MQHDNLFSHPAVTEPVSPAHSSAPVQNPEFSDAPKSERR